MPLPEASFAGHVLCNEDVRLSASDVVIKGTVGFVERMETYQLSRCSRLSRLSPCYSPQKQI